MAGEQAQKMCEAHPEQAVTGACAGCGKAVCRDCAKQFGYYCSQTCLEKGRRTITEQVRARARKNEEQLRRSTRIAKLLLWSLPVFVALVAFAIAWHFWLNPAGKVRWQWPGPQAGQPAAILGASAAGVTVLAGNTVVVLDPTRGTETRSFALPGQAPATAGAAAEAEEDDEDDGDYGSDDLGLGRAGQFRVLNDGSLLRHGRNSLSRITSAGQAAFERTYEEGNIAHVVLSPDETRAVYVVTVPADLAAAQRARTLLRQAEAELDQAAEGGGWSAGGADSEKLKAIYKRAQAAREVLAQTRTGIVCVDLATGQDLWASPKMKRGVSVSALAAGSDAVYAVFVSAAGDAAETAAASWSLFALQPADGSRCGQATLDAAPTWGPQVGGAVVLLHVGEELKAFRSDGTAVWTVKLPEDAGLQPLWRDGLLLLLGETSCRCLDPATGKEKWGVVLGLDERGVVVGAKRVYLVGQIEEALAEKEMKLPPAYQELDKMPELKGIMEQARRKIVQMAVALDRETGQELWRLRNAYGQPLGDDQRFVLLADTAQTSFLESATGGKGVTLVRQINPRNGKQMYLRQSALGIEQPVLVGKRIVGLAFERSERPSVFNPGAGLDSAGPTSLGVAAFQVK